jgi:hypothetical protein
METVLKIKFYRVLPLLQILRQILKTNQVVKKLRPGYLLRHFNAGINPSRTSFLFNGVTSIPFRVITVITNEL